jgi:hypothetical protein
LIRVYVEGVGLIGPGLASWEHARCVLAGSAEYVAAPTRVTPPRQLPAAEGRRTGMPVKIALAAAHEAFAHAQRDPAATATVFTSSSGDGDNVHAILERLATTERDVSPTRFHNSVHNAAAGYWGIASRSREPSTSLCAHDASFPAGLLDAAACASVESKAVALIAYDHPYPEPLHAKRRIGASFATALILTPERGAGALAALEIEITRGHSTPLTRLAVPPLEVLRDRVPAARALPLLAALARRSDDTVDIEYVAGARLTVRVVPCA